MKAIRLRALVRGYTVIGACSTALAPSGCGLFGPSAQHFLIPVDSIISGLSDPNLRNQVKYAILQTLHVFYAYDELMVSKKGERSVKNLLSAFEGFITRP